MMMLTSGLLPQKLWIFRFEVLSLSNDTTAVWSPKWVQNHGLKCMENIPQDFEPYSESSQVYGCMIFGIHETGV